MNKLATNNYNEMNTRRRNLFFLVQVRKEIVAKCIKIYVIKASSEPNIEICISNIVICTPSFKHLEMVKQNKV